jgi:hypothetical protein
MPGPHRVVDARAVHAFDETVLIFLVWWYRLDAAARVSDAVVEFSTGSGNARI